MELLVTPEWLERELRRPDLVVLDATLFLPAHGRDARAEFEAGHLPGARFMDLARFSPLPGPERLGAMLAELGVGEDTRAVVYDDSPLRSAARGWWLLAHAGVEAAVLDGGLTRWRGEGRPVESGPSASRGTPAGAGGGAMPHVRKADLLSSGLPIADVRSPGRFCGEEPEPRAGIAPGHMPGARNLPQGDLFHPDGRYKQGEELRAAFAAAGVDPERPFVATCGSGVTAASLVLAARLLGNREVPLYDGSWAEWGADPATPKVTGGA